MSNHQQKVRQSIRRQVRQQRQQLSSFQQKKAAKNLALNLIQHLKSQQYRLKSHTKKSLKIATYTAADGEINPNATLFLQALPRKQLYFPIIKPNKTLVFAPKTRHKLPRQNKYKISEPLRQHIHHAQQLDIIILPLVAASKDGDRLGMGGGFYDRTLSQLPKYGRKPLLIGVAHHFQILDTIPTAIWDYPLDAVITD